MVSTEGTNNLLRIIANGLEIRPTSTKDYIPVPLCHVLNLLYISIFNSHIHYWNPRRLNT